MNTQKHLLVSFTLSAMLLVSVAAMAQQQKPVQPNNPPQKVMPANIDANSYSYKLYNAPNNRYGYDIYKDGKPMYHQFVLMYISKEGKRLFATKPQAEKAALMAIEKIKKGEQPALTGEELRHIVAL